MSGERDGSHATAVEIALTQFAFPDQIETAPLEPALEPKSSGFTDAADFQRRYPDGRVGSDLGLSKPEHGERLYHAAVAALAERPCGASRRDLKRHARRRHAVR